MLSQLIELGGKRDARVSGRARRCRCDAMGEGGVPARTPVGNDLAFVEAVSVQRRIQILDRQAATLEKLVPLMQRRVEAGASSPSEVTRTQTAVGMTRLERERARLALLGRASRTRRVDGTRYARLHAVSGDFGRLVATGAARNADQGDRRQSAAHALDRRPRAPRCRTAGRAAEGHAGRHGERRLAILRPRPARTRCGSASRCRSRSSTAIAAASARRRRRRRRPRLSEPSIASP